MFRIVGDAGAIWFYDPLNTKVFDANGVALNLLHATNAACSATYTHPRVKRFEDAVGRDLSLNREDKHFAYDEKMTDLTIQLGLNCNLSCIYCSQSNCHPEKSKIDLNDFLRRLKSSEINWESLKVVQLWGGEPLVYWKHLRKIVEFVRKEIPEFKGQFHTTTNGSLLDMEKARFFVENDVSIQLSHDGVNHKYQRTNDDWLDDPKKIEAVLYLLRDNRKGDVNMTFAPMFNPNLFDSLELFDKKIPGVKVCCRSPLRCDSSNAHLMNLFTKENEAIARDSYYRLITLQPGDRFYEMTRPTRARLLWLCMNFVYGIHPKSIAFNCPSAQRYEMCFNLKGNFIPCHGSTEAMKCGSGNIDDLKSCFSTGFVSIANRPMCKGCLYTAICQGPCGMYGDVDAKIHCQSTKWAWAAWFDAVWKTIFGEKPVEIKEVGDVCFE